MLEFSILLVVLMILSGLIKGFVGFGLSLLLISILLDVGIEPFELMPIMVPLFVILDLILFIEHRKHLNVDYKTNFALHSTTLMTLFLGTLLGSFLLLEFEVGFLKLIFAFVILLILFLLVMKVNEHEIMIPDEKQNGIFGGLAGIMTGLFTLNGIPATIYLLYHQYPKEKYMAVLVTFLLISDIILVSVYLYSGLFTLAGFFISLQLLVLVLIGFFAGSYLRRYVSQSIFKTVVIIILALNAIKIIFEHFFFTIL